MAHAPDQNDDHHGGLAHDVSRLIERRRALALIGGGGLAALLPGGDGVAAPCLEHPPQTAGPFPADGSNRAHGRIANVLDKLGVVRADMRPSLEPGGPAAAGVRLDLTLRLADSSGACRPLAGHAIYLWHCDANGRYSIYDLPEASYLRAVGVTDETGAVTFTTVIPGCYPGRFPHFHYEVYRDIAATQSYRNRLMTSQIALPEDAVAAVFAASPAYAESRVHYARSPLSRDFIFNANAPDVLAAQTARLIGEAGSGYRGEVTIGLKA